MIPLTTSQLKSLNEKAHKRGFNRQLAIQDKNCSDGLVLKPHGTHLLLSALLFHTNYDGKQSYRCRVLMAIEGTDEPVEALLDVPPPDYKRLFRQAVPLGIRSG